MQVVGLQSDDKSLNIARGWHMYSPAVERTRAGDLRIGSAQDLPRNPPRTCSCTRFLSTTASTACSLNVMFGTRSALKASSSGRWLARQARDPFVRARNAAQASLDFDEDSKWPSPPSPSFRLPRTRLASPVLPPSFPLILCCSKTLQCVVLQLRSDCS